MKFVHPYIVISVHSYDSIYILVYGALYRHLLYYAVCGGVN